MRVLHIGLSSFPGGIESYVLTLCRKLFDQGVRFDYVDIYGDGLACAEELEKLEGRVFTVPPVKRRPIAAYREIKRIIRREGYQKVHIHLLSAADPIPALAASRAGAELFLHSHNPATVGLLRKTLDQLNKPVLRRLPAVRLACSEAAGRWMWGGRPFRVLVNTIDTERFLFSEAERTRVRQLLRAEEDEILLGAVGRLSAQKNPRFLLEVLRTLRSKDPRYRLLLVGDGPLREQLAELAGQYGIRDAVVFAGAQRKVEAYLSAMDLYLMPSLFEGFGIALIEAQASGLDCVVSDAVPTSAHATDGVTVHELESGLWAEEILRKSPAGPARRLLRGKSMLDSPYDSKTGAKILLELYRGGRQGEREEACEKKI